MIKLMFDIYRLSSKLEVVKKLVNMIEIGTVCMHDSSIREIYIYICLINTKFFRKYKYLY